MKQERRTPSVITAHLSAGMLSRFTLESGARLVLEPVTKAEAAQLAADCIASWGTPRSASACGYANTADVLTDELGVRIVQNRATVLLDCGDAVLLCAFEGERLPEFAQALPAGTGIRYFYVSVESLDGERA